ncbi:baseplate J/gp47 family protein [Leuconostocaceae bacterium ESL0958]|nr:baseplate J/gp47 family protein [Leuconostocaceae bacterium ESL0958]
MTPNELLSDLENMDFDYFMQEHLQRVPDSIDKREGSVIYDALAPVSYNLAEMVHQFHNILLNTYTQTAIGEFLDYRAAERGIQRKLATNSIVTASFTDTDGNDFDIDIGTRFASIGVNPVYYRASEKVSKGKFRLTAEQSGSVANRYVGQVLPVSNINGFGYGKIVEVEIPARDNESDDDLRGRILESNEFTQYGGNVADYIAMIKSLKTVGAVQVYPTWNGGGTVRLVIVNNEFNIPSLKLVEEVQRQIDPPDVSGNGYGIAPIGHQVTVAAPSARTLNLSIKLDLEDGVDRTDVNQPVIDAVNEFIDEIKKSRWGLLKNEREYQLTIYGSQIISSLLRIHGILNVSDLKINGEKDIYLQFDNKVQELPVVGSVNINV